MWQPLYSLLRPIGKRVLTFLENDDIQTNKSALFGRLQGKTK